MAIDKTIPILIVDDNKAMLRILKGLLLRLGFSQIVQIESGEEALNKLTTAETRFGLVIADRDMEGLSGFELLKQLRADEKFNSLPFILAATEGRLQDVVAAKKAGVSQFIVKPYDAVTLKKKLCDVLGTF